MSDADTPLEVIAFNLLIEHHAHINLLIKHRRMTLKGLTPLMLGEGGTEDTFKHPSAIKCGKGVYSLGDRIVLWNYAMPMEYTYIPSNRKSEFCL